MLRWYCCALPVTFYSFVHSFIFAQKHFSCSTVWQVSEQDSLCRMICSFLYNMVSLSSKWQNCTGCPNVCVHFFSFWYYENIHLIPPSFISCELLQNVVYIFICQIFNNLIHEWRVDCRNEMFHLHSQDVWYVRFSAVCAVWTCIITDSSYCSQVHAHNTSVSVNIHPLCTKCLTQRTSW